MKEQSSIKKEKNRRVKSTHILILILLILLAVSGFEAYQNYNLSNELKDLKYYSSTQANKISSLDGKINSLENQKEELSNTIQNKEDIIHTQQNTINYQSSVIDEQRAEIAAQQQSIDYLSSKLGQTTQELGTVTNWYNIAKQYEERVNQGVSLSLAYNLLSDIDLTEKWIKSRGITSYWVTNDDAEIWSRAEDIYIWLGNNYDYCSDRAFCVGSSCTQLQFFSPDELIGGSTDALCGDCDDQAHLFVGMMYASGIPNDRVRVECGQVSSGGHCWAGVNVNNQWYRVDPVCASPSVYVPIFGSRISLFGTSFSGEYENVDCFSYYDLEEWYTPNQGYNYVK